MPLEVPFQASKPPISSKFSLDPTEIPPLALSSMRSVGSKDEMGVPSLSPLGLLFWWGDLMNACPTFEPLGVVFHGSQSGPVPQAAVDDSIDG